MYEMLIYSFLGETCLDALINSLESMPDNLQRPYLALVVDSEIGVDSETGETIFHILAQEGCLKTLRKILSVNERPVIDESKIVDALLIYDNAGWSPLMAAVKSDRNVDDIIRLFLTFLESHATTEDIKKLIGKPQVFYLANLLH